VGATDSYSQQISRFVCGLTYDDLPAAVVEAAKCHLMDVLGVGLIGSRQDVASRAAKGMAAIPQSQGRAVAWGTKFELSAEFAAIANGIAAHVLDYDDTHTDSITHGSAVLAPTAIALGNEIDADGRSLLVAFVAGWETTARVGLAAKGSFHSRGFHTTSIAGVFGATVVAGKLLDLTESEMSHALGLAGSQASGVSEYLSNGSAAKSFHPGWAAHAGIIAARMAKAGMTGPMTVFEGRYGTFVTYGIGERSEPALVASDLGSRWEICRISVKPYPCCHFAHAFVDCAVSLRNRQVRADDVAHLECVVPEIELPLICEPFAQKLKPESPYGAKFSLPFLVAAGLIDGNVQHGTFSENAIHRRDLLELAQRVSYRTARDGETTFPRYFPGWITGRLRDGAPVDVRLDINRGNPDNPLSSAEIERKFRDNAEGVLSGSQVEDCVATIASLDRHSAGELSKLLAA
jgi:2-methylcitrate dehydratase PrpD